MRNRNKHKQRRAYSSTYNREYYQWWTKSYHIFSSWQDSTFFYSLLCGAVCAQLQHACKGQRAAVKNEFSPFTMWVLGTELRLSDLVARVFIHWPIFLSQEGNVHDYKPQASNIWRHGTPFSTSEMTMNHWGSWGRDFTVSLRLQNEFQTNIVWRMRLCFRRKKY